MASTTEKVSNVARLRNALPGSASPPYGSSGTVDLVVRASAIPPRSSATDNVTSDQASHAAAQRRVPPAPRSRSFVPSVTTSLYRTTVPQTLWCQP
jgi:hypothetical protein